MFMIEGSIFFIELLSDLSPPPPPPKKIVLQNHHSNLVTKLTNKYVLVVFDLVVEYLNNVVYDIFSQLYASHIECSYTQTSSFING
jgi:hypothetical protein